MTNDKEAASPNLRIRKVTELPDRLFAIGDVHGCVQEVTALLNHLKTEETLGERDMVLFIGDYIDRGPASKETVDLLIGFKNDFPKTIFLKGNHEDMLLAYLGLGGRGADVYMHNGGLETFRNYGIQPYGDKAKILELFPKDHRDFFVSLETGIELAEFLFVHAGINPAKSLAEQSEEDLFWIRRPFLEAQHSAQKTVVFGHTPFEDILLDLPFKIGIDTGLVYGNRLTCVELVNGKLLQVECGGRSVVVSSLEERFSPAQKT